MFTESIFHSYYVQPDFPDLGRWHRCEGRLVMVDFESLLSAAAEATASAGLLRKQMFSSCLLPKKYWCPSTKQSALIILT